mmetsp:Transcript_23446/g.36122  ORF Transcript_23446/g.36122 Transcript_23446/m.36122 type:complete len:210 (-) Transcript_23446:25-654(-)
MYDEENLKMAAKWIESPDKLEIYGAPIEFELTPEQKYKFIENFYASSYFDSDTKKALKEKIFESDTSDKGKKVQLLCDQSLPDPEQKERIWASITNFENEDTLETAQIKMQGFFKKNQQLELIQPYFEKYFDVMGEVVEKKDREFAEIFLNSMSPAFMARDSDETAFREYLRNPAFKERSFFILFLKKQMETIETVRKSRHLCETSKLD